MDCAAVWLLVDALNSAEETGCNARAATKKRVTTSTAEANINALGRVKNWDASGFIGTNLCLLGC